MSSWTKPNNCTSPFRRQPSRGTPSLSRYLYISKNLIWLIKNDQAKN